MTSTSRLLLACLLLLTASAQADDDPLRTLSVSGRGLVSAPPDMAVIQAGVQTRAESASEALRANSAAMAEVLDALRAHDIAERDIQTINFRVQPEYRHDRNSSQSELIGYQAGNDVRVRVRELDRLGVLLDALVAAGSNQLQGISFAIDDTVALLDQARDRAVRDARRKAERYAAAAGVQVSNVLSINEAGAEIPRPLMRMAAAEMDMGSSVPIASGEQELGVSVNVVFELKSELLPVPVTDTER